LEKAELLATGIGPILRPVLWKERNDALSGASFLVNTTTLGMENQLPLDLSLDALPKTAVVNDIVYRPLFTPLLSEAKKRGNPVVDGLWMLMQQGRPGFAAWFGCDPVVSPKLRAHVLGMV
jgi:shikimate dehydrogenase